MPKKITEEQFIKKHKLQPYYENAKRIVTDLWGLLNRIEDRYEEYEKNCKGVIQRLSDDIMDNGSSEILKVIHSVRYRVKDVTSLQIKIVKKLSKLSVEPSDDLELEKYRNISEDNYYKIITDLVGYRIILRYREQWQYIHPFLYEKYYKGDEYYVSNYIDDYKVNPVKPHIAECPIVYYRDVKDKTLYEQVGRDFYRYISSSEGYNSVHYIINIDGKYAELQVRTIFDEAWSECTHDLVYKNQSKSKLTIEELKYLSQCLAKQTMAAEFIVNLMYNKTHKSSILLGEAHKLANVDKIDKIDDLCKNDIDTLKDKKDFNISNIEKRMQIANDDVSLFDSNIQNFIFRKE